MMDLVCVCVCVFKILTNTLQQWEKICVIYSWVLRELLSRDIRWGITVGSLKTNISSLEQKT